jgi:hypothetical protein
MDMNKGRAIAQMVDHIMSVMELVFKMNWFEKRMSGNMPEYYIQVDAEAIAASVDVPLEPFVVVYLPIGANSMFSLPLGGKLPSGMQFMERILRKKNWMPSDVQYDPIDGCPSVAFVSYIEPSLYDSEKEADAMYPMLRALVEVLDRKLVECENSLENIRCQLMQVSKPCIVAPFAIGII